MNEKTHSLSDGENGEREKESVVKTAEQMDLILGFGAPYVDLSEKPFTHTCERLWRDRPEIAKAAIKLLAVGISGRSIQKRLNISHHTLAELKYQSMDKIAEQTQAARQFCFRGMAIAADKTIELLPEEKSAKNAAIVAGIFATHYAQFSGAPSAHIKISVDYDPRAELQKLTKMAEEKFEEMKRANAREIPNADCRLPIKEVAQLEEATT